MKGTEAGSYIEPVDVDVARRDPQRRCHALPEPAKKSGVQPPHVHRQVLRRDGVPRSQRTHFLVQQEVIKNKKQKHSTFWNISIIIITSCLNNQKEDGKKDGATLTVSHLLPVFVLS